MEVPVYDTVEGSDYLPEQPNPEVLNNDDDYLHHYQEEELPPPPPVEHRYDFDQQSTASSASADDPRPLASMAESVVQGVSEMKLTDKPSESTSTSLVVNGQNSEENPSKPDPKIVLFVKAGSDRECVGCCPFSQRLFMILWLKGVVFQVTTVDKATVPKNISDLSPGCNPPFLIFNGEVLSDIQKCEDFIEAELYPPRYPKLSCKHPNSNNIGSDIFAKFSALAKFKGNPNDPKRQGMVNKLNNELSKLNNYLNEPLDDEIDEGSDESEPQKSTRKFVDGNTMTMADCNLMPKLNMIRVAGREMLNYEIPCKFDGIHRYLNTADATDEFTQTCPDDGEIVWTYGGRKPRPKLVKH